MGVDISGRNPIVRGTKPDINWETATDEEKDKYFKLREAWDEENPGDYFRANWWSWRPIHLLIDTVIRQKALDIDTSYYGSNDGAGPDNQEDCDALADALQEILDENENLTDDDDRIYVVMGSWCGLDGQFQFVFDEKCADSLPKIGSILYRPFIAENGAIVTPSHSTSKWHLQRFINFLRECGGFQIW
jgi:hypothetical protein